MYASCKCMVMGGRVAATSCPRARTDGSLRVMCAAGRRGMKTPQHSQGTSVRSAPWVSVRGRASTATTTKTKKGGSVRQGLRVSRVLQHAAGGHTHHVPRPEGRRYMVHVPPGVDCNVNLLRDVTHHSCVCGVCGVCVGGEVLGATAERQRSTQAEILMM